MTIFAGLVAVVQYRGKINNAPHNWRALAAFDNKDRADNYAADCGKDNRHWEYRVIEVGEGT